MGDYNRSGAYWAEAITWSSAEEVMDGTLAFIRTSTLDFTPGTGHGYSNSGYHVLGAIVAKASGQTYYDYVREHIFRVAGMTSADFYTTPQWRDDRRIAHPYSKNTTRPPTEERLDAIDRQLFIGGPGGGCLSNATDLVRFTKALLGNKLLNPAFTQLTLSPKAPIEPLPPRPGSAPQIPFETYAPLAFIINNRWAVGHAGGTTDGVSTNLEWYPDSDWVVVTLSNYDDRTTTPIDSLARNLITQQ
jgi:CubicO group peptidase (beta-lactamase class C family)